MSHSLERTSWCSAGWWPPRGPSVRAPHFLQIAIRPLVSGAWCSSSCLPTDDASVESMALRSPDGARQAFRRGRGKVGPAPSCLLGGDPGRVPIPPSAAQALAGLLLVLLGQALLLQRLAGLLGGGLAGRLVGHVSPLPTDERTPWAGGPRACAPVGGWRRGLRSARRREAMSTPEDGEDPRLAR